MGADAEDVRPLLWELVSGVQRLTEQARTLLIAIDPSEIALADSIVTITCRSARVEARLLEVLVNSE